jgi:hypothetical protein
MPSPPARAEIVGPVTDDRVRNCIEHQRDGERETDARGIQTNYLAVEDQQEIAEPGVLDAEGCRAKAVGELGAQRWRL